MFGAKQLYVLNGMWKLNDFLWCRRVTDANSGDGCNGRLLLARETRTLVPLVIKVEATYVFLC
jgi:hypothetical protein